MKIDRKYIEKFINVTSKAAVASSFLVGKNQQKKVIEDSSKDLF